MDKSRLDFFPPIIIFFLIFLYGRFLAADFPEIWETLRAYLPEEMQAETENSGENEIYLELEKLFLRKIDINKESHMLADLFFLDSALAGKTTQAARIRPFKTLYELVERGIFNSREYELALPFLCAGTEHKAPFSLIMDSAVILDSTQVYRIRTNCNEHESCAGPLTPDHSVIPASNSEANGNLSENRVSLLCFKNLDELTNQGMDFKQNWQGIEHGISLVITGMAEANFTVQRDRYERDYFDLIKYNIGFTPSRFFRFAGFGALNMHTGQSLLFSTSLIARGNTTSGITCSGRGSSLSLSRGAGEDYLYGWGIKAGYRKIIVTGLFGWWDYDGKKLSGDIEREQEYFSAIRNSPVSYNTAVLYSEKNTQREYIGAGTVEFNFSSLSGIGISYMQAQFKYPVKPALDIYRYYRFFGKDYCGIGVQWNFSAGIITFCGEGALFRMPVLEHIKLYNFNKPDFGWFPGITGGIAVRQKNMKYHLTARHYDKKIPDFHSRPFAAGSAPGESGVYSAWEWSPRSRINITAYIDLYRRNWISSLADTPVHGSDFGGEINLKIIQGLRLFFQERIGMNDRQMSDPLRNFNRQDITTVCSLEYKNQYVQIKPLYKILAVNGENKEISWTASADLDVFLFKNKNLKILTRYGIFNAPHAGISSSSRDLPGSGMTISLSGKGSYAVIIPKIEIAQRISFNVKYLYIISEKTEIKSTYKLIKNIRDEELKAWLKITL